MTKTRYTFFQTGSRTNPKELTTQTYKLKLFVCLSNRRLQEDSDEKFQCERERSSTIREIASTLTTFPAKSLTPVTTSLISSLLILLINSTRSPLITPCDGFLNEPSSSVTALYFSAVIRPNGINERHNLSTTCFKI